MNDEYDFYDDEQLFGVNDWELYKRGEQPKGWLEDQKNLLMARCHAQNERLKKLLSTADPDLVRSFDQPL